MIKWALIMVLVLSGSAFAAETCVEQYKGICRDAFPRGEIAEAGAFIDCDDNQVCCVADSTSKKPEADSNYPVRTPANGSAPTPAQRK